MLQTVCNRNAYGCAHDRVAHGHVFSAAAYDIVNKGAIRDLAQLLNYRADYKGAEQSQGHIAHSVQKPSAHEAHKQVFFFCRAVFRHNTTAK